MGASVEVLPQICYDCDSVPVESIQMWIGSVCVLKVLAQSRSSDGSVHVAVSVGAGVSVSVVEEGFAHGGTHSGAGEGANVGGDVNRQRRQQEQGNAVDGDA